MKLFKIRTKKGILEVGGIDQDDAEKAFKRIYPHLVIIETNEMI